MPAIAGADRHLALGAARAGGGLSDQRRFLAPILEHQRREGGQSFLRAFPIDEGLDPRLFSVRSIA